MEASQLRRGLKAWLTGLAIVSMRTIDKSHYQLWGNSIEWIDKESLRLYGEMRLTPKVGDKLIDGANEYKFTVVNECENNKVFFAEVEKI